jgi:hypothetical protein
MRSKGSAAFGETEAAPNTAEGKPKGMAKAKEM